jgi:hypothetical protein
MKRWQITVRGQDKGEAYKSKGAWHWYSSTRGTETYGRLCEMRDVQKHVARVCRVPVNEVGFQVLVLTEGQKAVKRRQASSLGGAAAAKARRTATLAAKAGSQKVKSAPVERPSDEDAEDRERRLLTPQEGDTAPPPPPAPQPGEWTQTAKDQYEAPPREGERMGLRIKIMPYRSIERYYCYRNGGYLGSDGRIEDAKARCESGTKSERPFGEELGDTRLPAFLALTPAERKVAWGDVDSKVLAVKSSQADAALAGRRPSGEDPVNKPARVQTERAAKGDKLKRAVGVPVAGKGLRWMCERLGGVIAKTQLRTALKAAGWPKEMDQFEEADLPEVQRIVSEFKGEKK